MTQENDNPFFTPITSYYHIIVVIIIWLTPPSAVVMVMDGQISILMLRVFFNILRGRLAALKKRGKRLIKSKKWY